MQENPSSTEITEILRLLFFVFSVVAFLGGRHDPL